MTTLQAFLQHRWRRRIFIALVLVLALGGSVAGLVATPSGLRVTLALAGWLVPGLSVESPHGTLLHTWGAARIRYHNDSLRVDIVNADLDWDGRQLLAGRAFVHQLKADSVRIATKPSATPPRVPDKLAVPLPVSLQQVSIGRIELTAWSAAAGLEAATLLTLRNATANGAFDNGTLTVNTFDISTPAGRVRARGTVKNSTGMTPVPPTLSATLSLLGETRDANAAARTPSPYSVEAMAEGPLDNIRLHGKASGYQLDGRFDAQLTPFATVALARASIDIANFDPRKFSAQAPEAALTIKADIKGVNAGGFGVEGPIRLTNHRPLPIDRNGIPVAEASAVLRWSDAPGPSSPQQSMIHLDNMVVVLAGNNQDAGRFSGSATLDTASRVADLKLEASGVALSAIDTRMIQRRVDGTLVARLAETAQTVQLKLEERVAAAFANTAPWRLTADLSHQNGDIEIRGAELARAGARIEGKGQLQLAGERRFQLDATVARFNPAEFVRADLVPTGSINSRIRASGSGIGAGLGTDKVNGDLVFSLDGSLAAQGAEKAKGKEQTAIPLQGAGTARIEGGLLSVAPSHITLGDNRIAFDGRLGITKPIDDTALNVDLRMADLAMFSPMIAPTTSGFSGTAQATIAVTGSLTAPVIRADMTLEKPGLSFSANESIRLAGASLSGMIDASKSAFSDAQMEWTIRLRDLQQQRLITGKTTSVSLMRDASLQLRGTPRSHRLNASATSSQSESLQITLEGGIPGSPATAWQGALTRAEIRSRAIAASLQEKAALRMQWAPKAWELALSSATLVSSGGRALIEEAVIGANGWRTRGSVNGIELSLVDMASTNIETLFVDPTRAGRASGNPPGNAVTSTRLDQNVLTIGGAWNLSSTVTRDTLRPTLSGFLRLFRERGDLVLPADVPVGLGLSKLELGLQSREQTVTATLTATGTRLGELSAGGTIRLKAVGPSALGWTWDASAPLAGQVRLKAPSISWAGPLVDPNLQLAGALDAELDVEGSVSAPRIRGTITGEKLGVTMVNQGIRLHDGTMKLGFNGATMEVDSLRFVTQPASRPHAARLDRTPDGEAAASVTGPGALTASGRMNLESGVGSIQLQADKLALLTRPDQWLIASGNLDIRSTNWRSMSASGKLRADQGYFEVPRTPPPSLSDDVEVTRGSTGVASRQASPLSFTLDLEADLGNRLYFSGRGLDTRLAGSVRVRAEPRAPLRFAGSVRTRGGVFDAYGQKLTIERGILNLQGPLTTGGLNVRAVREGLPVIAGVEISGTIAQPRVRLVSEPDVPDAEKLSWIVTGRGTDALGADPGLLLSAAYAILGPGSSDASGSFTRQLSQSLGVDSISFGTAGTTSGLPVRTVAGTTTGSAPAGAPNSASQSGDLATQIVTVGKRLSRDAYLSYEQSLAGASSVVKLTYNLSRRVALIGRAGTDNSLDISFSLTFR